MYRAVYNVYVCVHVSNDREDELCYVENNKNL